MFVFFSIFIQKMPCACVEQFLHWLHLDTRALNLYVSTIIFQNIRYCEYTHTHTPTMRWWQLHLFVDKSNALITNYTTMTWLCIFCTVCDDTMAWLILHSLRFDTRHCIYIHNNLQYKRCWFSHNHHVTMHFALATIDRGIIPPHCLISDEHAMCKRCTHSQCEMTSALYLWTQTCVHCKLHNHDVLDTVVTIEHDSFSFVCARCTALYSVFTLFVISTIIQNMSFPHTQQSCIVQQSCTLFAFHALHLNVPTSDIHASSMHWTLLHCLLTHCIKSQFHHMQHYCVCELPHNTMSTIAIFLWTHIKFDTCWRLYHAHM